MRLIKSLQEVADTALSFKREASPSPPDGQSSITSLSFEQEPELGEGEDAGYISQYPLEDILDKFLVHVSDFYEDLNKEGLVMCYQEFASPKLENIESLREIIGKHVYNKEEDGRIKLIIE